jgi:hypothetical protein
MAPFVDLLADLPRAVTDAGRSYGRGTVSPDASFDLLLGAMMRIPTRPVNFAFPSGIPGRSLSHTNNSVWTELFI